MDIRTTLANELAVRRRAAMVAPELRDHGWMILLNLAEQRLAMHKVDISATCLAAGVSTTTGLRYLKVLVEKGWVRRFPGQGDTRRVWLRITDEGFAAIEQCLGGLRRAA